MPEGPAARRGRRSPLDHHNLRRTDWRVLLPVPPDGFEHLILLGGRQGLSDAALDIGLARRVSQNLSGKPSADAIAILRDAQAECEAAAAHLLPGGTLYWEVECRNAPWGWVKNRILRTLRRANLSLVGLYWVQPDFDRAELFLPLESRTAMEWYLRNLSSSSSLFRRFFHSSLGAAAAAGALDVRRVRHCAITAVAGQTRDAGPSILTHPAIAAHERRDGLSPLVLNRASADASRRLVVFPFRPRSADPVTVLKLSRLPERNEEIEDEQKIAAAIRSRLDASMQRTIPAPLGTFRWCQLVVGAETYARGRSLSNRGTRFRRRSKDLLLVAGWLQEFHRQTRVSGDRFSSAHLKEWIERPLQAYGEAFGKTVAETHLFDRVCERARSLFGSPFPLVWCHPAFSEWNICRFRDEISVIDWEAAEVGPALSDLIYFSTLWYYRSGLERGERVQLESFQDFFLSSTESPLRNAALGAFDDYMKNLSIDPRLFPVMLVLTWVVHALGRLKRSRAYSEPQADPRRGNLHVSFLKILAENHARLLPPEDR
jgi:phosphotransferase family enzyme